jgi:hypothetical protein
LPTLSALSFCIILYVLRWNINTQMIIKLFYNPVFLNFFLLIYLFELIIRMQLKYQCRDLSIFIPRFQSCKFLFVCAWGVSCFHCLGRSVRELHELTLFSSAYLPTLHLAVFSLYFKLQEDEEDTRDCRLQGCSSAK